MEPRRHFGWAVEDRVAIITLDRPERRNPLTFDSYRELAATFRALGAARPLPGPAAGLSAPPPTHRTAGLPAAPPSDHTAGLTAAAPPPADSPAAPAPRDARPAAAGTVAAVVLTGAAGHFCSGGDVHEIIGPLVAMKESGRMDLLLEFTHLTGELVKAMRECPQPIIAAVDGTCAGAGAILAMASDLRLGTPRSKVAFLFARVGLSGADMGACAMLPRIVGQGRAAELLYTGRTLEAAEAERWGFFNRLVPPEELLAAARELAGGLAHGPAFAHAMTKRALHQEWSMGLAEAIEAEAQTQAICMQTEDFARAYRAFAAREKPVFEGR